MLSMHNYSDYTGGYSGAVRSGILKALILLKIILKSDLVKIEVYYMFVNNNKIASGNTLFLVIL